MENKELELKTDERGSFIEVFKMPGFGQVSFSTTHPGFTRGNHYHLRKKEYFCVVEGHGLIRLRNRETGEIKEHDVSGGNPEIVEMTINWTHNIKNIGDQEMKLMIWISEVFDPADPDTYREEV